MSSRRRRPSSTGFPCCEPRAGVVPAAACRTGQSPEDIARAGGRACAGQRAMSLALHAALLVAAFLWFRHGSPAIEAPDKEGAVELVMVQTKGAGRTAAPREPAPAAPAAEAVAAGSQRGRGGRCRHLRHHRPRRSPRRRRLGQHAACTARAGGADDKPGRQRLRHRCDSHGIALVPARPTPSTVTRTRSIRSKRHGVRSRARSSCWSTSRRRVCASSVDIVRSSGFPLLDNAAREAVAAWHFLPAVKDGLAIPFDMPCAWQFSSSEGR